MANLILELIATISLAIIVYLMAAAVPRIEEDQEGKPVQRVSLPLEKLDNFLLRVKDKLLRRTKVLVMKADNFISKQLKSKKDH